MTRNNGIGKWVHNHSLRVLVSSAIVLAAASAVHAQEPFEKRETRPFGATALMSPDGQSEAHFGTEYPAVLYVKNLSNGVDQQVARSANIYADWDVVDGLAFSADSKKLVFAAGPPRIAAGSVYTVNVDGSDLKVVASDKHGVQDSSGTLGFSRYCIGMSHPVFSPNGKRILVDVAVSDEAKRSDDDRTGDGYDKEFVGLLSSSRTDQDPKLLAEGRMLFWGLNGEIFYYIGTGQKFVRFNLISGEAEVVSDAVDVVVLGRVPGKDMIFTWHRWDDHIEILSLDGSAVNEKLKKFVSGLSALDREGRHIARIDSLNSQEIELKFIGPRDSGEPTERTEKRVIDF